jgi:hypothetical protein
MNKILITLYFVFVSSSIKKTDRTLYFHSDPFDKLSIFICILTKAMMIINSLIQCFSLNLLFWSSNKYIIKEKNIVIYIKKCNYTKVQNKLTLYYIYLLT